MSLLSIATWRNNYKQTSTCNFFRTFFNRRFIVLVLRNSMANVKLKIKYYKSTWLCCEINEAFITIWNIEIILEFCILNPITLLERPFTSSVNSLNRGHSLLIRSTLFSVFVKRVLLNIIKILDTKEEKSGASVERNDTIKRFSTR